jgi:hypothetical protein
MSLWQILEIQFIVRFVLQMSAKKLLRITCRLETIAGIQHLGMV